jgi:hypothetical protein
MLARPSLTDGGQCAPALGFEDARLMALVATVGGAAQSLQDSAAAG